MTVEIFKSYCLSHPGTWMGHPFCNTKDPADADLAVFYVEGKWFAFVDEKQFEYACLKCEPQFAEKLRAEYDGVVPAWHMNKKHWNSVYINSDVPDSRVFDLISHSYGQVVAKLPKSKQPSSLEKYIEGCIIPRYDNFDAAHRRDHVESVISRSLKLAENYDVRKECIYATAAYHDTGLAEGRETHHLASGNIIRTDSRLHEWFSDEEIETIAQAEDHRASGKNPPRTIYGMIVAEADRLIDARIVIRRTVQYGLSHYPELDKEGQYLRTLEHLENKYADGGYLKLWLEDSPNAAPLEELRRIIRDEKQLRTIFEEEMRNL